MARKVIDLIFYDQVRNHWVNGIIAFQLVEAMEFLLSLKASPGKRVLNT